VAICAPSLAVSALRIMRYCLNYTTISYRVNGLQCAVPDPSPSVSFS